MTEYRPLTEKTLIDYIKSRPAMAKNFPDPSNLTIKEVGDGNLNLVFIVESPNKQNAVVIKQALPYLRVAGESWPLTRERMRFESSALMKHNELAPGLAPVVYDYDDDMSAVCMEYLGKHDIMRKPMVARKRFPKFVDHISTFIANTLFYTSDLYLTGLEKKTLQAKFINPHLNKIQEDFVFTNPYMESPENRWNPLLDKEVKDIRSNAKLKIIIGEVKETYMAHAQALIHSDLHTGSIMVNDTETKVIDPEFAFYGPMGYDIGALIANLIINYLSHYAHTPDVKERTDYQAYIIETVIAIWNEFEHKFEKLWAENNRGELVPMKYWDFPGGSEAFAEYRRRYIKNIFFDTVGHGGCKILRRMMGIVSVWDITSIESFEKRALPERLAMRIGTRWLLERENIKNINDMIGVVLEESKGY
ncbi:MAG: S-methyl-5-thioribose kinase [Chloroflexota bacterium]